MNAGTFLYKENFRAERGAQVSSSLIVSSLRPLFPSQVSTSVTGACDLFSIIDEPEGTNRLSGI